MNDIPYRLRFTARAANNLRHLDKKVAVRIRRRLRWLAANANTYAHYAMEGQWSGYFRFRIGDYRAIYGLNHAEHLITVETIGHRSDVYDE